MKRMFLLLILTIFIFDSVPIEAKTFEAETIAWVDFSAGKTMKNFSAVTFATDTSAVSNINTADINGSQCWEMQGGGNFEYIRFNITNTVINGVKDGREYVISVEYYDGDKGNKEKGFFSLEYDAIDRKQKAGGLIKLENSGTWKTAEFKLDDAYFGTRMMSRGADFRLTVVPQSSTVYSASPVPVAVRRVRVAETGVKRTIRIVSETGLTGNTFSWDGEKVIKNNLKNTSSKAVTADFTFKAVLDGDKTIWSTTKNLTIASGATVTENVSLPFARCGVYTWVVSVSQSDGIKYDKTCMKFAVVKTDKDGIRNDKAFVAHHLNRYFEKGAENREIVEGMEMIAKSNAGGIRAECSWSEIIADNSSELVFEGTSAEMINDYALRNELDTTWLLTGGCYEVTGSWNSYPDTENELKAYKEYVSCLAEKVKNTAVSFEVAHEIDNANFNPVINSETGEFDATPEEYLNLIKATAEALDSKNIKKPLIAYGLIGLDKSVEVWIDSVLDKGLLNYADTISYHPYTNTLCHEKAWNLWYFAPKLEQKLKKVKPDVTMAITEVGTSIANNTYIDGKRSRGANNCRAAIAYTARNLTDFVTHYVFEDKGQLGNITYEDGYGMVENSQDSLRDDSDAIFIPTDTYVSFTAMNYILAQSEPWQIFELGDNISASGFESSKFNNRIVVLNSTGDFNVTNGENMADITVPVVLALGTNEIKCYDDFGNETILKSDNGVFGFMLNERPLYIMGDITEVTNAEGAEAGITHGSIKTDDSDAIGVYGEIEEEYTAELLLPDYVTAPKSISVRGGSEVIPVRVEEEPAEKSVSEIVIKDSNGNNVFFGQVNLKPEERNDIYVRGITADVDYSDSTIEMIEEIRIEFSSVIPEEVLRGIVLINSQSEVIPTTTTMNLNSCVLKLKEPCINTDIILCIRGYSKDGVVIKDFADTFGNEKNDFIFLFFNENGNCISKAEAERAETFKVNVLSLGEANKGDCSLIYATYDNGVIMGAEYEKVNLTKEDFWIEVDVPIRRRGKEYVKLMIWKSIGDPIPFGTSVTVGK